jgi:hypothetical protein
VSIIIRCPDFRGGGMKGTGIGLLGDIHCCCCCCFFLGGGGFAWCRIILLMLVIWSEHFVTV